MAVHVEKRGAVTTVILDRPQARNAVDRPTADALRQAFKDFDADDDAKVAVLWGAGGHFCAGADLKAVADGDQRNDVSPEGEGPMGPTRLMMSKPVIAAVSGFAVAGGLELALWCDLRVAENDATFGVYCRRWGVPLIDGGTVRLPRLIGHSRALDMILTGRAVGAEEALQMGLANRVVARGEARAAAEALAGEISRFPQACMLADRSSSYRQWDMSLDAALHDEAEGGLPIIEQEAIKGAARFKSGLGRHGDFSSI
ncbi:crotonase/enoyl-CoA hydratase family protein [Ferrovibrio terrae]|uniref:Crotonase/enoyl-CoA hydratase family protein n=1 Tax=Ferrovibrio terrae TaxID=2594003 RepID=A0A516H1N5_9PROT|nr:crotonase/enoyl-CoA hydratase family protein [Ferrovibrio terrae]QDO97676.1 crotonase/enoyl-CoA hydratase family protein [Ferrovibrio terrae]